MAESGSAPGMTGPWLPPQSIDEARALARERFRRRLQAGEPVGGCGCGDEEAVVGGDDGSPTECVVGVRFRDSGRVYYFRPSADELLVGDWVVVPTARGHEAARVVIDEHQVRRALLQGELGTVIRRLSESDVARMEGHKREAAMAVRLLGEQARERDLGIKPIAAEYSFDGSRVTLNYSIPDRERAPDSAALRDLARVLASCLATRIELRQVGPRDEARLLGGVGRCGRTLCCSSWLPVFPEISMGMAKNQDLPLNPAKVSGVCGRLLCCLSYENEQYRQMKAVMPKLGQAIETPRGAGQVVSLHLLKELITVRLDEDDAETTFRCDELGLGAANARSTSTVPDLLPKQDRLSTTLESTETDVEAVPAETAHPSRRRRRRRRAGGRKSGG